MFHLYKLFGANRTDISNSHIENEIPSICLCIALHCDDWKLYYDFPNLTPLDLVSSCCFIRNFGSIYSIFLTVAVFKLLKTLLDSVDRHFFYYFKFFSTKSIIYKLLYRMSLYQLHRSIVEHI